MSGPFDISVVGAISGTVIIVAHNLTGADTASMNLDLGDLCGLCQAVPDFRRGNMYRNRGSERDLADVLLKRSVTTYRIKETLVPGKAMALDLGEWKSVRKEVKKQEKWVR